MSAKATTRRKPDAVYVQARLPLKGATSMDCSDAPLEDDRLRAIEASVRYLDRLEARTKAMPGISEGDRTGILLEIKQRRKALRREQQRGG